MRQGGSLGQRKLKIDGECKAREDQVEFLCGLR